MVLNGAGHDFGGRGRTAIDQHDDRFAIRKVALLGVVAVCILLIAPAGRDDFAPVEEGIGHRDRLCQQAAGVVAQVDDITTDIVRAQLVLDLGNRFGKILEGLLREFRDAQHADIAFDPVPDGFDFDIRTGERHLQRLFFTLAGDGQLDIRTDETPHQIDRLTDGHAQYRLAINMRDEVVRLDSGLCGGRFVDRRDDFYETVLHRDLDAEAAEFTLRVVLHVGEIIGVQVAGMGVERCQHPVDGGLDQLLLVHFLHIGGTGALEHVSEQVEIFVGRGGLRFPDEARCAELRGERDAGGGAEQCGDQGLLHCASTFRIICPPEGPNHSPGSMGAPRSRI